MNEGTKTVTRIQVNTKTITACYQCPYHEVEGMECIMVCRHEKLKCYDTHYQMIISSLNCHYGFPNKCPLFYEDKE